MASQHILATPPSQDAILNSLLENAGAYNARLPRVGLRECDLDAEMPLLPKGAASRVRGYQRPLSAQVHGFFNALRDLEEVSDKQSSDEPDLIRQDDGLRPAIHPECLHHTFHTRRLTVQNPDSLPLLTCLWERLPIAFSSQALQRFARVWEGPWRDARAESGRGVRHVLPLLPSSLTKMPDLVGVSSSSLASSSEFEGMDPVSLKLRGFGSRLEELEIRALSWLHMRHLKVEFHSCAPDGSWYLSGPRGEDPHATGFAGDDNIRVARQRDMFRTLPIAERINLLLLAFASSLQRQRMPSLQNTELFTWVTWQPWVGRAQEYKGDWRPGDEVIKAFKDPVSEDGENMEWEAFECVGEREQDPAIFI
ncbi:hypothetical protein C8A01DRAFT_48045 [Parachaetomium inaequale]|uniref:Uncharacterized protein n=1 Tax=Parachaetomium inaequale TaxID=2588326 RepID=A0AAN6PCD3_9PEZI|nr:hypothetical protein C8A01DRAFT_48045 [Parachaetomium inaequale]